MLSVRVVVELSVSIIVVVMGEVMAAEAANEVAVGGGGGGGLMLREPTANPIRTKDMPQNHATKKTSR